MGTLTSDLAELLAQTDDSGGLSDATVEAFLLLCDSQVRPTTGVAQAASAAAVARARSISSAWPSRRHERCPWYL